MCGHTKLSMIRYVQICQKVQAAHTEDKMRKCCLKWIAQILSRLPDALFLRCQNMMIKGVKVRHEITWKGVVLQNLDYLGV